MSEMKIKIPREKIEAFCKKNHIQKLAFFGSVLREDFGPKSDIDVLVEFERGKTPGLTFFNMQAELSEILGRKVDLNTPGFLSKYFRDQIMREAQVQYVKA
jgi:predicted nucleotidyltransferase